jgi:hypothetical protein
MANQPIPMPLRDEAPREKWQRRAQQWQRRAQVRSERLRELLRAARTPEGRRRNLAPLLVIAAGSGFVIGLAMGMLRRRR